jgi:serine/threonine-protein kinase
MTPERWRQIDELFDGAVRVEPAGRDAWLRAACGGDDDLQAEVSRLLAQDEWADRDGFLTLPSPRDPAVGPTGTWPAPATDAPAEAAAGFTPKEAIAPQVGQRTISEPRSVVRARLRELPMVYILILGASALWRYAILGRGDPTLARFDGVFVVALVGIMALLSSRWPVPLGWLKALELAMVGAFAGRIAVVQYRVMLESSLRGDVMVAQLTFKNVVLVTAVTILTYGLYVPKSWRRAALVAGPLAVLPFANLLLLAALYPVPMGWLWQGWKMSPTPRVLLFTFDALILLILAVGATFGARTISRLRRQVAEARQLGQYRLCQRIGKGGMGEVYLAEHELLKRPSALKLIRPGAVADRNALLRFEREVRLTATLSHPNTVEVYDYGRAEDGTYYYVMEYLPGLNLAELVKRHGALPSARVVYLLRQVCGALHEAHAAGLIHRDIKPSNIFAARRGGMDDVAKLLDFGLVRPVATADTAHLSIEGHVIGTPLFMAPEQAKGGRELDERSDLYSLGAVAYYLLTGRPPFAGATVIAVLLAHAQEPVVPPSQVAPDIPEDLERVVLQCLAKDPADRFPDAENLERALGACACAEDWDQARAARWWREADRFAPTRCP